MPKRKKAKAKNPKRPAKRLRLSAEERADIAAVKRGMRQLKKHGGYVTYDARQIANW